MPTTEEIWSSTQRELDGWKTKLAERKGARDQLIRARLEEQNRLDTAKEEQQVAHQAHLFLQSESATRREQAIQYIEGMATPALRMVYGPRYRLQFNTFEEKRSKEGANNFKMEIQIASPFGDQEVVTSLKNARGGGVMEIVAFSLRIAALNWLRYKGPLIIDEAYKAISTDHKIDSVAQFLREVTNATGRQLIFVTHMGLIFGPQADKIVWVGNNDGLVRCKDVTTEELFLLMESEKKVGKERME